MGVGILGDVQQASDWQLLADFVRAKNQRAFGTLVQRHINLVYSAALRRTHDSHLADDVTQAVFVILAKKAATLTPEVILSAWLHRTTRYAAMDALKLRNRRVRHETRAAEMKPTTYNPEMDMKWPLVSPVLDEAIDSLSETDRRAVMLRFYENRSFAEVGATLGLAEDAARKRVSRAAEKLRAWLTRRGAVVSAALLTTMLHQRVAEASAPGWLAGRIIDSAGSFAHAPGCTSDLLAQTAIKRMWWRTSMRVAAGVAVAALLFAGLGVGVRAWLAYEAPRMDHSTR